MASERERMMLELELIDVEKQLLLLQFLKQKTELREGVGGDGTYDP